MPQGIWIVGKHTGLKGWAPWNAAANKGSRDSSPECSHVPDKADMLTNTSSGEMASRLQSFLKQTYGPERVKHRVLPIRNGYLRKTTHGRQASRAIPSSKHGVSLRWATAPTPRILCGFPLAFISAQALLLAKATMSELLDYSLVFCSVQLL